MEDVDKTVPEGRKNADDDILSFPACWKEAEKVGWQKYYDRCSFKSVKEAKADETVPEGWEGSSHECPEGGSSGTMEVLLGTWTTRRKPWEAIVMKKQVSLRRPLTKRLLMIT